MLLLLVRHGEALPEKEDPGRPLSPQGRAEVQKMAAFLSSLGLQPEAFWHSGKCRAQQTAVVIREAIAPRAHFQEHENLNPNDPTDPVVADLTGHVLDLAIVGHMPYLSRLVSRLLISDEERSLVAFPSAGAALLERSSPGNWYLVGLWKPDHCPRQQNGLSS